MISQAWITFDAPSEASYESALEILRRNGYREWQRRSPKDLPERVFTQRRPSLRLYWVEPKQCQPEWLRRLRKNQAKPAPEPKYWHIVK
jgi:hypothetical protein